MHTCTCLLQVFCRPDLSDVLGAALPLQLIQPAVSVQLLAQHPQPSLPLLHVGSHPLQTLSPEAVQLPPIAGLLRRLMPGRLQLLSLRSQKALGENSYRDDTLYLCFLPSCRYAHASSTFLQSSFLAPRHSARLWPSSFLTTSSSSLRRTVSTSDVIFIRRASMRQVISLFMGSTKIHF